MSMHSFLWRVNIKIGVSVYKKKVREKSRECYNRKPFPEEDETDKSKHAQIEQTYEKH